MFLENLTICVKSQEHGKSQRLEKVMVFTGIAENYGFRDFCCDFFLSLITALWLGG